MRCAGIVGWLGTKSSCPCCRAHVPGAEPYRYPARTQLRSAFLRERLDRRSWSSEAPQSMFWDGMNASIHALINARAQPLDPVPEG